MYGAMSNGTINMMRHLAVNNGVPKYVPPAVVSDTNKIVTPVIDTLIIEWIEKPINCIPDFFISRADSRPI